MWNTAHELLTNMLIENELDKEAAERCSAAIIDTLVMNDFHLVQMEKAHHMGHGICSCGCGTVQIVFYDETDHVFASGQLFPDRMIKFCEEVTATALSLIPKA